MLGKAVVVVEVEQTATARHTWINYRVDRGREGVQLCNQQCIIWPLGGSFTKRPLKPNVKQSVARSLLMLFFLILLFVCNLTTKIGNFILS